MEVQGSQPLQQPNISTSYPPVEFTETGAGKAWRGLIMDLVTNTNDQVHHSWISHKITIYMPFSHVTSVVMAAILETVG